MNKNILMIKAVVLSNAKQKPSAWKITKYYSLQQSPFLTLAQCISSSPSVIRMIVRSTKLLLWLGSTIFSGDGRGNC